MTRQELEALLQQVASQQLDIASAAAKLNFAPFEELGFAKVDTHREQRCGFPEVIFAEGKSIDHLLAIAGRALQHRAGCLATRVSAEQATIVSRHYPASEYDPVARTMWISKQAFTSIAATPRSESKPATTEVLVLAAGTSDLPVAQEAFNTARYLGSEVELIIDVGVAGLHRLLAHQERLYSAKAIVVVAGMEGALPSIVGGLVACPVVAVPTSVGYGANFGGLSALLCMLNACASNVTVVNIDAGFKGGYVASLIAQQTRRRSE